MNSINARLFSSSRAALFAAALTLLGVCTAHAQAKPQAQKQAAPTSAYADPETAGSVTEPQGESYVAPQKLNPKLARVTLYRPAQGFAPGVAHLEVNGHYLYWAVIRFF